MTQSPLVGIRQSEDSQRTVASWLAGLGTLLLLLSLGLAWPATIPAAFGADSGQNQPCSNDYPQVNPNYTYAVLWQVKAWLVFQNQGISGIRDGQPYPANTVKGGVIPIGPSRWDVKGRYKSDSGDRCFEEDWALQTVVRQGSGDPDTHNVPYRGWVINRSDDPTTLAFNNIAFDVPENEVSTGNTTVESNFQPDANYSPLGLYGVLRKNSQNLQNSTGYVPVKWTVHGKI